MASELQGLDYASDKPSIAALTAYGAVFVCRYLSRSPSKNLTAAEARELAAAGIWIVVVWETTARRAAEGRTAGIVDALDAQNQGAALGMPPGRPVYFAVDWDATAPEQGAIDAYLNGAASVLGADRVGVYGGYSVVRRCLDNHTARWAWQTYAWSAGLWHPGAVLQQYRNETTVGGADVDFDRATADDYGQWMPGITPTTSQEDDVAEIASLGADGKQVVAPGDIAPILFETIYTDKHRYFQPGKDGKGYSIIVTEDRWALCDAIAHITGVAPGAPVDVMWTRMTPPAKAGGDWVLGDDAWRMTYHADADGTAKVQLGGQFSLDAKRRLRLRVANPGTTPITIASAMIKVSLVKY